MAFEIVRQKFGDLTEYLIQESGSGNRFVVVPELGGIVRQLSLRKDLTLFSILKTPPTPDTLRSDSKSASELLFPFASRIPDGKYTFFGKDYQLEKNEDGGMNAIHGLVRKKPFQLHEQLVQDHSASLELQYHLEASDGYPFDILFSVTYTLDINGKFTLTYKAINQGNEAAPVMFGWHPYFLLGNEDVEPWKMNIPSDHIVTFDDNMIPTGQEPFTEDQPILLNRKVLDNCFKVKPGTGTAVTELISVNQDVTLHIEQETGEGKFNFLVVYTPPARDCVAIEPLTSNVDAFNTGDGLNVLAPGNEITGTIALKLT